MLINHCLAKVAVQPQWYTSHRSSTI